MMFKLSLSLFITKKTEAVSMFEMYFTAAGEATSLKKQYGYWVLEHTFCVTASTPHTEN